MPDDAIRHVFNDRTANMSITVLNLTEASTLLRTINRRDIKDVRAIDLDLALVLENGHKIIISRGAVAAVNSPQLVLEFADGDVILGEVFEKLNHIEVPPDAAVTVTSKEIKRYGIKRVVKAKDAGKDNSEEQADARPEIEDGKPAAALADEGALKQPADIGGMIQKSDLTSSSLNDSGNDKAGQAGSGGVSWPLVAGGLGLLAAAAGGGGGGGGGSGGGAGSGSTGNAATPAKPPATLSGATALGPLNNATITAYDSQGNVIGKPVQIVNGRYSLVLDQSDYKGLILLAVRDNTPGVADNFADEATLRVADLGNTVLRSVVLADGSNQTINVTALTELAVLKAGLASGQTNLAASQIGAPIVAAANAAVSALFKVNVTSGALITTSITDAQGAAVVNPDFASNASVTARNYGAALKAIANLQQTDPTRYADQGAAIQKLADSLQFTDALATRLRWSDPVTQADLFNERLNARANDVTLTAAQRQQARTLLDSLQKLPDGSNVTDYLLQNHVGSHYRAIGVSLDNLASTTPSSPIDPDKLALFNSVVGAQSKTGVGTPERLEKLAATAGDLIRLARESAADPVSAQSSLTLGLAWLQKLGLDVLIDEPTRQAFLDAVRVKGNAVDPATRAPRSDDSAATHDVSGVNSIEKLVAIASGYAKVLGHARNATGPAPLAADYQAIGVQLPAVNAPQALQLLNSVIHAQPDTAKINTIAGLNRLALTVEQLMQVAAVAPLPNTAPPHYPAPASPLTVAELQWLGVGAVNVDNLAFLLNKLQSTADDGSALASLAALQSLADAAASARNRIVKLAQDNNGEQVTAADLEAVGLGLPVNGSNSNAECLKLFNEALQSTAIDGSRANTPALLQTIIDAARRVVDSTAGHAPPSPTPPTADDLVALGLPPSEVQGAGPAAMSLLIDSITARPFVELGRDHAGTALSLPGKLSHPHQRGLGAPERRQRRWRGEGLATAGPQHHDQRGVDQGGAQGGHRHRGPARQPADQAGSGYRQLCHRWHHQPGQGQCQQSGCGRAVGIPDRQSSFPDGFGQQLPGHATGCTHPDRASVRQRRQPQCRTNPGHDAGLDRAGRTGHHPGHGRGHRQRAAGDQQRHHPPHRTGSQRHLAMAPESQRLHRQP